MKTARTFRFVRRILILATVLPLPAQEMNDALRSVTITPGVELHYIEKGKGVPVIFIHGTLGDYSVWQPQLRFFAGSYRALAYSRRYNYPNTNPQQPNHSATVEADDLVELIRKLNLGKVHLVGHSYGGYTALIVALKHPELVRSLTLAEPPIVFEGDTPDESKQQLIKRARAAFAASKPEDAIRAIVDAGQEGKYDRIPPALKSLLIRNAAELKALVTSSEMYPPVKRSALQKLAIPTLLLSGENSTPALKTSDAELERLLPEKHRKRVIIQGADHGLWFQQPDACRNATLDFLKAN